MAVWISLLARAEVGADCWGVKNWYRSCRTKPLLILGPCAFLGGCGRVEDRWRRAPPLRPSTLAPPGLLSAHLLVDLLSPWPA